MAAATLDALVTEFDVSRETSKRLAMHIDLLEQWNPRINLVAKTTIPDVWSRHVADSAQLWRLRPAGARLWLDLGSGAGFPGLVIAILAAELEPDLRVALVESDQRKAAFLSTVVRKTGLRAEIRPERIERLPPMAADIVSARALAPLPALLDMLEMHRAPGGIGLFPKGASVHKEIAEAAARWRFDHVIHASLTDPQAAIVEIGAAERV